LQAYVLKRVQGILGTERGRASARVAIHLVINLRLFYLLS